MAKVLLNAFGKRISEAVNDKARLNHLVKYIESYIDKNNAVIFDQGPSKPLLFSNNDSEQISIFTGIEDKEVKDTLKHVASIQSTWKLLNTPFIILSVFVIRELEIQKKYSIRDLVIMYVALRIYSGKQKTYFKYGVNENVMSYTLNTLTDKFKYKALKNNYAVLQDTVNKVHESYLSLLLSGEDEMLNTYYPQMYNRVNKVLLNIASEYYENYKNKNYLNTVKTYDEETGALLDYEDSDGLINSIAEMTTNYFYASSVNMDVVRRVSERNGIPYVQVAQTITSIRKEESPGKILRLVTNILTTIYETDKSLIANICTTNFAINALKQLSISNSSSQALENIKTQLNELLDNHCSKYAQTQRLATKMSYRNAIYSYFVYIMIGNRCG